MLKNIEIITSEYENTLQLISIISTIWIGCLALYISKEKKPKIRVEHYKSYPIETPDVITHHINIIIANRSSSELLISNAVINQNGKFDPLVRRYNNALPSKAKKMMIKQSIFRFEFSGVSEYTSYSDRKRIQSYETIIINISNYIPEIVHSSNRKYYLILKINNQYSYCIRLKKNSSVEAIPTI